MNHIFYLHSNTCVISAYDTVERLVNRGENVVVVLERKTTFPFFTDKVKTFNMQPIIDQNRKQTASLIAKVINYKKDLHPACAKYARVIINNQDFLLYTPSYNMFTIKPFVNDSHCKGYYYIEEGYQAYLTEEKLDDMYKTRRFKEKRILLGLVGLTDKRDYEITSKFKGCIALSDYSFPWCKNKVITSFNGYFNNIPYKDVDVNNLISTDFLRDDIDLIIRSFKTTIDRILDMDNQPRIAIKFHPTAYAFEKDKVESVVNYIKESYPQLAIQFLPASYSVEALMYHRKINLFNIFGITSLMLYGLMLNTKPFMVVHKADAIDIRKVSSIPDFLVISNTK